MKKYTTEDVVRLTGLKLSHIKYLKHNFGFKPHWYNGYKKTSYYSESDLKKLIKYKKAKSLPRKRVLFE